MRKKRRRRPSCADPLVLVAVEAKNRFDDCVAALLAKWAEAEAAWDQVLSAHILLRPSWKGHAQAVREKEKKRTELWRRLEKKSGPKLGLGFPLELVCCLGLFETSNRSRVFYSPVLLRVRSLAKVIRLACGVSPDGLVGAGPDVRLRAR